MKLNIRNYKLFIVTDAQAVRVKKVLDYNKEPIMPDSRLNKGVGWDAYIKFLRGEWQYCGTTPDKNLKFVSIDEFENLFGEKQNIKTNKMTVTRKALALAYNIACNDWQRTITSIVDSDRFAESFYIDTELIKKAWGEAMKESQFEWLRTYLPKPEYKFKVGDWLYDVEYGVGKIDSINVEPIEETMKISGGSWKLNNSVGEFSMLGKRLRLATPEEIEKAQWYPDGTACLIRDNLNEAWHLYYADGKGKFYDFGNNSGLSRTRKFHQKLDMSNLPLND